MAKLKRNWQIWYSEKWLKSAYVTIWATHLHIQGRSDWNWEHPVGSRAWPEFPVYLCTRRESLFLNKNVIVFREVSKVPIISSWLTFRRELEDSRVLWKKIWKVKTTLKERPKQKKRKKKNTLTRQKRVKQSATYGQETHESTWLCAMNHKCAYVIFNVQINIKKLLPNFASVYMDIYYFYLLGRSFLQRSFWNRTVL